MDNWTVPPTQFGRMSAKADLDGTFLRDVSDLKGACVSGLSARWDTLLMPDLGFPRRWTCAVLILNTGDTLDELREQLRLYFHTNHPQLVTKGTDVELYGRPFCGR